MTHVLCQNCRLPVVVSKGRCPECEVVASPVAVTRSVPVAAAVALFATFAVLAGRKVLA